MDITEISVEQNKTLLDYYLAIGRILGGEKIVEKAIEKIRKASSNEEAVNHYVKLTSVNPSLRFGFYKKVEEKVKAIQEVVRVLDYFGVAYPVLPDSIKSFFK